MDELRQVVLKTSIDCSKSGRRLAVGDLIYEDASGSVICLLCGGKPQAVFDFDETYSDVEKPVGLPGSAGASAQREYERRRLVDRQLAKRQRPRRLLLVIISAIAGYLAVQIFASIVNKSDSAHSSVATHQLFPSSSAHEIGVLAAILVGIISARNLWRRRQSTESWRSGAQGERIVGARLSAEVSNGVSTLHDRQIPGSKANIDHISVGPAGVYVIDTKVRKGQVSVRKTGPFWNPGPPKLLVGGRDHSSAIQSMSRQVAAVRSALSRSGQFSEVPIFPVLVIVGAEWSWFARPYRIGDVYICWPKELSKFVRRPGPFAVHEVHRITQTIVSVLPEA